MAVLKENTCVRVFQAKEGTTWLSTCVKTIVGRL